MSDKECVENSAVRELQLDEIIAEYLRQKQTKGRVDEQEFVAGHPLFAADLQQFFADQRQFGEFVGPIDMDQTDRSHIAETVARDVKLLPSAETFSRRPEATLGGQQRYQLKDFHARGGMGEIWRAEDLCIGREVAVKRLRRASPDLRERFQIEAQITGQLEHPGIVPLYDLGVADDGSAYCVMQFVKGRTFKDAIADYFAESANGASTEDSPRGGYRESSEIEFHRLLEIFLDLCHAVAYAHSRGVVHRDLKPDNVMLGSFGEVLLIDWGLAKVKDQAEDVRAMAYVQTSTSGSTATHAGAVMGSPAYMSPEAAAGKVTEIDELSDIYLLGATLYETLTGSPPRRGSSVAQLVDLAKSAEPVPPRKANRSVPPALDAICRKAMSSNKAGRYFTALDLAADIRRYLAGEPVSAHREPLLVRAARWRRKHRRKLSYAVVAMVVAGMAAFGFSKAHETQRLKQIARAEREIVEFRRLADHANFFAANIDPHSENVPYYDVKRGSLLARQALRIADGWGRRLENLPLPDSRGKEKEKLKDELYAVLLLSVQSNLNLSRNSRTAVEESMQHLQIAETLAERTRSFYRLRSICNELLGSAQQAADDRRLANDPRTRTTAVDHFLLGEAYRMEHVYRGLLDPESRSRYRKQLDLAAGSFQHAIELQPDHYWSHHQLGRCYMGLERYADAIKEFSACIAIRPDSQWAYSSRGFCLAMEGDFHRAFRDLNRVVAEHPDFMPGLLNRGLAHALHGDPDRALGDFNRIMEADEEHRLAAAAYHRSQIRFEQGNAEAALADLNWALQSDPALSYAYSARAALHFAIGSESQGLADLNAYLMMTDDEFDTDSWQAHHARGKLLLDLHGELPAAEFRKSAGLQQLAIQQLRNAVRLGGQPANLFVDLGGVLERTGRPGAALDVYSSGLTLNPANADLHIDRAWIYAMVEQEFESARTDFETALRLDPGNVEAQTGLGYVHAKVALAAERNIAAARKDLESALQSDPANSEVKKALDEMHARIAAARNAAENYAFKALLQKSGDYLALHNVACIYSELSESNPTQFSQHQQQCLDVLAQAKALWERQGAPGGPLSMVDLIENEPSFRSIRSQPEFLELLQQKD